MQESSPTLLLDLGNTRLKLGSWCSGQDHAHFLEAHAHADMQLLLAWLNETLDAFAVIPRNAFGVSVADPTTMQAIETTLAERNIPITLQWVWPQEYAHGVTNGYSQPNQLGADRWTAMLGLMQRFGRNHRSIVLANFGTATTVDTLTQDRHFLGGLIFPGVSMMQASLSQGTARLPLANGQVHNYPTDTHSAITTGIVAAQLGAIRRQVELSAKRDGQLPIMCVSGGAWHSLASEWARMLPDLVVEEVPHVVLEGLILYANAAHKENFSGPVV